MLKSPQVLRVIGEADLFSLAAVRFLRVACLKSVSFAPFGIVSRKSCERGIARSRAEVLARLSVVMLIFTRLAR